MRQLTSPQWDELIAQYVELIVDSMEHEDLVQFVTSTMTEELSEIQCREALCDEIKYTLDEEIIDELIDNVTSEKCTTYEELIESNTKQYPINPDPSLTIK